MATSQNNYSVLTARTSGAHPRLRKFYLPGIERTLLLRDGSAGFLLIHQAVYFDKYTERLDLGIWDEWGHAVRPIRGKSSGYSNHASGTACDLNATRHPRGVSIHKTFTPAQINGIHKRLERYDGCIRWGGDYHQASNVDGMHFEIAKNLAEVEKVARRLMETNVGKSILRANAGLEKVILS